MDAALRGDTLFHLVSIEDADLVPNWAPVSRAWNAMVKDVLESGRVLISPRGRPDGLACGGRRLPPRLMHIKRLMHDKQPLCASEYSLMRGVAMAEARHGGLMSAVSFWCDEECLALLFYRCLLVMDTRGHVHQYERLNDGITGLHVGRNLTGNELWFRGHDHVDNEPIEGAYVIV
jgi:hypothetical protein